MFVVEEKPTYTICDEEGVQREAAQLKPAVPVESSRGEENQPEEVKQDLPQAEENSGSHCSLFVQFLQ